MRRGAEETCVPLVTFTGEFEPSNKFFNPLQFTALVTQLASKLCVLGQTRVLFSGPGMLQTVFKEMHELAELEARRCVVPPRQPFT